MNRHQAQQLASRILRTRPALTITDYARHEGQRGAYWSVVVTDTVGGGTLRFYNAAEYSDWLAEQTWWDRSHER